MALTQDDLQAIGEIVEGKIQAAKKEISEEIKAGNTKLLGDISELFHETWRMMDTTNERVTALENHLGIASKN